MDAFGKEYHLYMHECLLCQSVSDPSSFKNASVDVLREMFNEEIIFH